MVFGPTLGAGLGAVIGVAVGSLIYAADRPKSYKHIIESADKDDNIRFPAVANITPKMRELLQLEPEWTFWPDYDRWTMINRLLRTLWPKLTAAILKEVVVQMKPILQETLADLPYVPDFVEDIMLGEHSLLDAEHLDPYVLGNLFTLGTHPPRVSGMKVYHTTEDTCIFETPVMWGSDMHIDLSVYLKVGPVRLVVPVQISHLQFKVLTRIVLQLVDPIPCIGGATVTLLKMPYFDMQLRLFKGPDLMSLPGVKQLVHAAVEHVVGQLALYPASVSLPLMANYGAMGEPKGMLHVQLHKVEGLKSSDIASKADPYVVFEVREGRSQRSRTIDNQNNAVFNEEFFLVVDDYALQCLNIMVMDEDLTKDDFIGCTQVLFSNEYIKTHDDTGGQSVEYQPIDIFTNPMTEKHFVLPIFREGSGGGRFGKLREAMSKSTKKVVKTGAGAAKVASLGLLKKKQKEDLDDVLSATIKVAHPLGQVKDPALHEKLLPQAAERLVAAKAKAAAEQAALLSLKGPKAVAKQKKADEKAAKAAAAATAKLAASPDRAARVARRQNLATKAELDQQMVLVEEEVALRGNEPQHGDTQTGTVHLSLMFMPFAEPEFDDDIEMTPAKEGLAALLPFAPPPARDIATNVSDFQKGLLTVKLIRAAGLTSGSAASSIDAFVELVFTDCDPKRVNETQKSTIKWNDDSPRWNEKFDFVMVSAGSVLTLNVWDKKTLAESVLSLNLGKSRFQNKLCGRVSIPVLDVVRNGHLKDSWALQEAESGTIEMKLEWSNCYVDDYMD